MPPEETRVEPVSASWPARCVYESGMISLAMPELIFWCLRPVNALRRQANLFALRKGSLRLDVVHFLYKLAGVDGTVSAACYWLHF